MPTAWRIVKRRHAARAFDGEGARIHGGRWNFPGTPMVYLATTRALALLEILVHLGDEECLQASYVIVRVDYEAAWVRELPPKKLPLDWNQWPAGAATRALGDAWIGRADSLLLTVPSVIVPEERILLMNPRHPKSAQLKIGRPISLNVDPRLKRKS